MTTSRFPESTRALVVKKSEAKPVYHDAVVVTRPLQQLTKGEVLVKMGAVSFNHRDVSDMASAWQEFFTHPNALTALDTPWSIPRDQLWERLRC
jgi:hypothetical protein